MVRLSLWLISLYRFLAPDRVRQACRFEPTCSEYAILALKKHGFFRAWALTMKRLLRCRPPHGGEDYP
ncbi:MAG TPA: membrane protein insertion efficiency factor YidD [Herbaspirillum sp.]